MALRQWTIAASGSPASNSAWATFWWTLAFSGSRSTALRRLSITPCQVSLFRHGLAQSDVGMHFLGVDLDGSLGVRDGTFHVPLTQQRLAHVLVGLGVFGIKIDGLLE